MRRARAAALALVAAAAVAVPAAAAAAPQAGSLTLYGKPTKARYTEHSDDRERGDIKNPLLPSIFSASEEAFHGFM